MKLLENRSNLDLTGIRNLELGAWKTVQSYPSYPKLDHFAYLAFLKASRIKRLLMVRLDERFFTSLLNLSDNFLGTTTFREKLGCVKKKWWTCCSTMS